MRFAFVIFKYFPYGGVQRDMLRIAQDCVKLGHEVTIFAGEWRGEKPENIDIVLLKARGLLNHHRHQSLIAQMQEATKAGKFERVIGFNRMPNLDVYFAADPCYAARMQFEPCYKKISGRFRFFSQAEQSVFGANAKTHVLLLNQRDQAIFQHWYRTPDARFHLIPPNIPLQRFSALPKKDYRAYVRNVFALPDDAIVLLTVGSAFLRKGVDRAIHALAALPANLKARTYLIAVGEFESASNMSRYARQLGVEAQCIEAGGRPDVAELMLGADLLLHAARSELAGIVLIEAMTSGLPLLVTEVCGYANYVLQANAGRVLNSPFNQTEMNNTLTEMLDGLASATWSSNAKTYVQAMAKEQVDMPEARLICSDMILNLS